jgi:hypothetical protein
VVPRALIGIVVAIVVVALPRLARAEVGLQLTLGPGVLWTRSTPTLTSGPLSAPREIGKLPVPMRGGLTSVGGYLDTQLTIADRTTMPLFGFGYYGAVGSYATVVSSLDGSVANIEPWTAYRWDLLLPGLGGRWKHRRWMVEASVRTGVAAIGMHGSVATGADTHRVDPSGLSFLLAGQASVCRRLDPWQRLCVEVAPRIYDFGFLNGATAGLRWEWGI